MSGRVEVRFADPASATLDKFNCGSEPWSELINGIIRERKWLGYEGPPDCFEFHESERIVGYAVAVFAPCPHPTELAGDSALYLMIRAIGIEESLHGEPAHSGNSYFVEVMRLLEAMATDERECLGLYLWVNVLNERARGAYEKVGFVADPERIRKSGKDLYVMRKPIAR